MIVILFGPPGSGKGTQARLLARQFDMAHIATGDILREEVASGSALGREVAPIMEAGELIPDDLIVRVIRERLRRPDARRGALLDGFPRTPAQARALEAMLVQAGRRVGAVVHLAVPDSVLRARIMHRAAEEHRADDTLDTLEHRLEAYRAKTAPVLDFYETGGVRVAHIDGDGAVEDVTARIAEVVRGATRDREAAHS